MLFGRNVPFEMLMLWLVEFSLYFVVLCLLLQLSSDGSPLAEAVTRAALFALGISFLAVASGLYRLEICLRLRRIAASIVVVGILSLPVIILVSRGLGIDDATLADVGASGILIAWLLVVVATRAVFGIAMRQHMFARRIVFVGTNDEHNTSAYRALRAMKNEFFELVRTLSPAETASPADKAALLSPSELQRERIWGVVIAADAAEAIPADDLLRCKFAGIQVFRDVEFLERYLRRIDIQRLRPGWLLFDDSFSPGRLDHVLRRTVDVIFSLGLLLFTLPLMLVTALAIKLDSPGPVFYRQERLGQGGQVFTLIKFRSMRIDAEANGPVWAKQRDSRVTRVGAFIRKTRIDELPQLLNILGGDMHLVGPRPERPHFVDQLAEVIPFYRDRALVKPGLTGWAQVNFPYGASIDDARMKLSYDLYYIKNRSFMLDLFIILSTVRVVLLQEGSR